MGESVETTPLLQNVTGRVSRLRYYLSVGVVILVFRASEELAMGGAKQYIYYWSEQYLNSTGPGVDNTSSVDNGGGGNDECGGGKTSKTGEDEAQALAARWQMYYDILSASLVFISTAVYGILSDYMGRKTFGCISLFGTTAKCSIYAVVVYFDLHIAYLLLAYSVDGVCGSTTTFFLYAYASSADITSNVRDRVLGVALIEGFNAIGILTTEIATGYFIKDYGFFYPMFTGACGTTLGFILGVALLKETSKPAMVDQEKNVSKTFFSNIPNWRTLFKNYVGFYTSKDQKGKPIFWLALGVFFLVEFVNFGRSDPITLYQLGRPFCWDSELIGWYGAAYMGATYMLGVMTLKPILHVVSERLAACVGILSFLAMNVITAFATTTQDLFISVGVGFLGAIPTSIIRGLVSTRVSARQQGAVLAGLQSSKLICSLVAGPIALTVYSHTLDSMRGAVFLVFAGINAVTLIMQIVLSQLLRKEDQKKGVAVVGQSPDIQRKEQ